MRSLNLITKTSHIKKFRSELTVISREMVVSSTGSLQRTGW